MQEEGAPVSFPCVVEISKELAELDEKRVEDPKEGEQSPVGMVVVKEVEDESLEIRSNIELDQVHLACRTLKGPSTCDQKPFPWNRKPFN